VARVYPLDQAIAAYDQVESRHTTGKVVLRADM
jgi:NADPH:quinone reductase-like Zn-dependent oxidoreductase